MEKMNTELETVKKIVDSLGATKDDFLNHLQLVLHAHLRNQTWQDCLTIVERKADGTVCAKYVPGDVLDGYAKILFKFLRKKTHNGHELDSYLTDGIVDIVTTEFNDHYTKHTDDISKPILAYLFKNQTFANQLKATIIGMQDDAIPSAIKNHIANTVMHQIESSLNTNVTSQASEVITTVTGKIVATATAAPISKSIIMILIKNMSVFLKGTVAKIFASTAFKTMFAAAMKKLVAVKIIGALIALLGITSSAIPIWFILLPIIAAFIYYEVATLPEKIADKVSNNVKSELSGEFQKINENIATNILKSITMTSINTIASGIAKDTIVKNLLNNIKAA